MRKLWFGSSSPAVRTLATAFFTLLLTAANAPAQSRSDSNRDDSSSSNARDNDNSSRDEQSNNRGPSRNSQANRPQEHASLGVMLYNDQANPLEVRRVLPDSPAEEAGLERGDEITSINGRRVTSVDQLRRQIDRIGADQDVELGILRDGRRQTVTATLGPQRSYAAGNRGRNQPSYAGRQVGGYYEEVGQWQRHPAYDQGFWDGYAQAQQEYGQPYFANQGNNQSGNRTYSRGSRRTGNAQDPSAQASDRYSRGDRGSPDRAFLGVTLDENARDRVRVSGVYPDSPADLAGIRSGDEIIAIDDQDVHTSRDLQRLLAQKDIDDDVHVSVDRNGRERTLQATLISQSDVLSEYNRNMDRMGRRNSYAQPSGNQSNYRDGYNDSRRQRQRDENQDDRDNGDDSDNY